MGKVYAFVLCSHGYPPEDKPMFKVAVAVKASETGQDRERKVIKINMSAKTADYGVRALAAHADAIAATRIMRAHKLTTPIER